MKFLLEIITPLGKVFSEEVDRVMVPTSRGTIGILAQHTPLFTSISEGEIKIASSGKEYFLAVGGGFMDIGKRGATVLVSRAYHADELNEAEIRRAQESARQTIARRAKGEELAAAQAILRRSILELKVFHRRKSRPPHVP